MCAIAGIAAASVVGGGISAMGAESAAGTQAQAAENAQQISMNEFNTITGQEQPYMNAGYGALNQLDYLLGVTPQGQTQGGAGGQGEYRMGPHGSIIPQVSGGSQTPGVSSTAGGFGSLLTPFTAQYMKQYSPAYQFQLQQGQQGVLNQDASSQGALSGAALKDLIGYNQNYANTAFNSAFNQYQTQQGNTFQRLAGIAQLGQAAATNTGQQGTALAGQAAQSATNIGTAQAAGTVGAANALSGGLSNAATLSALYGGQAGGFGFTPQDISSYNSPGFNSDALTTVGGGYTVNTPGYTG